MKSSFSSSALLLSLLLAGCGNADRPATTQAAAPATAAVAPVATPAPISAAALAADTTAQDADLNSRTKGQIPLIVRIPNGMLMMTDANEYDDAAVGAGDFGYQVNRLDQKRPPADKPRAREMTTLPEMVRVWKDTGADMSSVSFKRAVLEEPAGGIYELSDGRFAALRVVTVGKNRYLCSTSRFSTLTTEIAARRLYELMGQARAAEVSK